MYRGDSCIVHLTFSFSSAFFFLFISASCQISRKKRSADIGSTFAFVFASIDGNDNKIKENAILICSRDCFISMKTTSPTALKVQDGIEITECVFFFTIPVLKLQTFFRPLCAFGRHTDSKTHTHTAEDPRCMYYCHFGWWHCDFRHFANISHTHTCRNQRQMRFFDNFLFLLLFVFR